MKKLLFLLLITPTLTFSQVSNWRSNPPQQQSTPQRSTPSIQPSTPQRNDVSSWRNDPPRDNRQPERRPGSNIIIRDPYWNNMGWGWNRWNVWGAPGIWMELLFTILVLE